MPFSCVGVTTLAAFRSVVLELASWSGLPLLRRTGERIGIVGRGPLPGEVVVGGGRTGVRDSAGARLRVAIRPAIIPPMRVVARPEAPHVGDRAPTTPARRPGDPTHGRTRRRPRLAFR